MSRLTNLSFDLQKIICGYLSDEKVLLNRLVKKELLPLGLFSNHHILIYGQVQSGKTATIIQHVKNHVQQGELCVIVLQNSLLMLNQYKNRLYQEGITRIGILCRDCPTLAPDVQVILLINNKYRYQRFVNTRITNYVLFLDEYDVTQKKALRYLEPMMTTYYISATPCMDENKVVQTNNQPFDHIIYITPPPNYHGLPSLHCQLMNERDQVRDDFLSTDGHGMLLVNDFINSFDLFECAKIWNKKHPQIPIVVVTMKRIIFIHKFRIKIGPRISLSTLLDKVAMHPKIIVFALRLVSRGLSYVTSNYSRHITHQIIKNKHYVNYIQSMRILGIYDDVAPLYIYTKDMKFLARNCKKWADNHQAIMSLCD